MRQLQSTWIPGGQLFFWAASGSLEIALDTEVPELKSYIGPMERQVLAVGGDTPRRRRIEGYAVQVGQILPLLPSLRGDEALSDSLRCWSMAAGLGLELAHRQAVVPHVSWGHARWRALLSRRIDRERLQAVVNALPAAARAVPTRERGALRLQTSSVVVRGFIDHIADELYRQDAYPGPSRGWSLEFAQALRGENSAFNPRDARYHGVPAKISAWSRDDGTVGLRVGLSLELPRRGRSSFGLSQWVHPSVDPSVRVPVSMAWGAGEALQLGDRSYLHPAHAVLTALARAKRIFGPLGKALSGSAPRPLQWNAREAWAFLSEGVGPLQDAGFEVELPAAFSAEGARRIRARMRIEAGEGEEVDIGEMLTYRWEVVLGDLVLSGADFAEILSARQPIVRFRGDWVLLDPAELENLPEGLPKEGVLDAAAALRAVLTGQHNGVPVVADDRLGMIIDALKQPPQRDPPEDLHATLRPYQERGFSWLACLGDLGLGACLADDMGLGKTVQVIAHLLRRHGRSRSRKNSLVVCPTSVIGNWTHELRRFAPGLTVGRYHGVDRDLERARESQVVLTTYGLLSRDIGALSSVDWEVVALDEAQAIKNPDSQRAKAAVQLKARHRVAMSGTPVENRLEELWSIMQFLVPGLLGSRARFKRHVAIPVEKFGDAAVAERLKLGVSPFLMRRLKTDPTIIDDLPDKVEVKDFCALTTEQRSLYNSVAEDFLERISGAESMERRGHVLAMLTALKQICNHPDQYLKEGGRLQGRSGKLDRLGHLIDAIVEAEDRVIIFTQYREMGTRLSTSLGEQLGMRVPFLHGGVSIAGRDEMVRTFQEDADACPVLLISLRAGGTGLNLTAASHVVHYDRWWNPAVEDQATDRAYRIGQKKNVQVHKFICQGTYEERIDRMLEEKRALAESVVGSGESLITELDDAALRALVMLGDDAVLEDE